MINRTLESPLSKIVSMSVFVSLSLLTPSCKNKQASQAKNVFTSVGKATIVLENPRGTHESNLAQFSNGAKWSVGAEVHKGEAFTIREVTSKATGDETWHVVVYADESAADIEMDGVKAIQQFDVEVSESAVASVRKAGSEVKGVIPKGSRIRFVKRHMREASFFSTELNMTNNQFAKWKIFKGAYADAVQEVYTKYDKYLSGVELPQRVFWDQSRGVWVLRDAELFLHKEQYRYYLDGIARDYPNKAELQSFVENARQILSKTRDEIVNSPRKLFSDLASIATTRLAYAIEIVPQVPVTTAISFGNYFPSFYDSRGNRLNVDIQGAGYLPACQAYTP